MRLPPARSVDEKSGAAGGGVLEDETEGVFLVGTEGVDSPSEGRDLLYHAFSGSSGDKWGDGGG
jgi:hypothetical protein